MKDEKILARAQELAALFADIPDDVLMRFANRKNAVCTVFSRASILRELAARSNSGREQLKSFLYQSVPDPLRREPSWSWGTSLKSRYEKSVSCGGACVFTPPLPCSEPERDGEYVKNAQEVARRDRELLKKIQQNDEVIVRRELLGEAEFNTACGNSESARAESAFRDGVVRAKLAELERYVKEQMEELRSENRAWLEALRRDLLPQNGRPDENPEENSEKIPGKNLL